MVASPLQPFAKAGLIALMALGSVVLWIGSPIGWLWVASQMQKDTQAAGFGPYMVVLLGIAITAVVLAKVLQRLNRLYGVVAGDGDPVRVVMPWHRGLRGENEGKAPRTVLDVVMVIASRSASSRWRSGSSSSPARRCRPSGGGAQALMSLRRSRIAPATANSAA